MTAWLANTVLTSWNQTQLEHDTQPLTHPERSLQSCLMIAAHDRKIARTRQAQRDMSLPLSACVHLNTIQPSTPPKTSHRSRNHRLRTRGIKLAQ
ncbi:hypothetical protein HBH99_071600 [Parastagonospora nodorum]|nr:hypothetical protein HBH43_082150 [Parastagonospora nodorum]KAH4329193.1 hypothetical protein HBI00_099570 [Parastagonospora nodorum]KAH4411316.1 hypothetical protein HBH99_071600 [Parastagonospora nodorum]KAH4435630.1 hypothetical protein HBH93_115410 [Parastagonospora nodorum]KAH4587537.1 hypothetical protein HBH83_125990 [Parastagonospora nodorum]